MIFKINLIHLCLLVADLADVTYGKSNLLWSWNIFRKRIDHYDKDIERKSTLRTDEWIKKLGYPCEVHVVTTEDDYILVLHRIPRQGKQPVLLVHGLVTSSLSFVMLGLENGLAFQLAINDYDVWLINTRGTTYSRNHTYISSDDPLYWKFSFHEIGFYDIPASIDHIRISTSFHEIIYIGHSQGATALFVLCSLRPEYNEKILLAHVLAPIVFLRNVTTISKETVKIVKRFVKDKTKAKSFETFPKGELLKKCAINSPRSTECIELMWDIMGSTSYNQSLDPIILGAALAGGSVQEIEHYLQIYKSGDFVAYDYGLSWNLQVYKHVEPDAYNLSKVTLPIIIHYGRTDSVATPEAVHRLYKELPGVRGVYAVQGDTFNHYDFMWSKTLHDLVNTKVLKLCEDFLSGVLKYRID